VLEIMLILPPFYPPSIEDIAAWWRHCTYLDVHRLALEVLHQRLTLVELDAHSQAAVRQVGAALPELTLPGAPLAKLGRQLDHEIKRCAPIFRSVYEPIVPFSDEWLTREAAKGVPQATPDPTRHGVDDFPALPAFQSPTISELREAWRSRSRGAGPMPLGQRLILETVRSRQLLTRLDREVRVLQSDGGTSEPRAIARVNLLHKLLKEEMRHIEPF
jgi:hypothetical protein